MQINIKYTNLDSTPAIDQYIREKIGSLAKFIKPFEKNREIIVRMEIARTNKRHHKGEVFYAEANLDLPGKLLRAEYKDWNVRVAIDQIKDKLQQQIKKFRDKLEEIN